MRKLFFCLFLLTPHYFFAQIKVGVKAGLNLVNVTETSELNTKLYTGYFIGGYIAPKQKGILGYRSELILSRQGYNYKTNTNTGKVDLDYLLLPQLLVLQFTKKLQVHIGGQIAFLLNAQVDSSNGGNQGSLFSYFTRFDYGAVAGFDVSPVSGFVIGSRLNISLPDIGKNNGNAPNFISKELIRNNVLQGYVGWRF
jgi:Outer membrane protein beta-barrel domain